MHFPQAEEPFGNNHNHLLAPNGHFFNIDLVKMSVSQTIKQSENEVATGEKVKSTKGLFAVESVTFDPISARTLDYYYRVEPIGKKEENQSRVTLFLSAGYYNFLDSETYPKEVAAARTFLQSLAKNTLIYRLQEKIKAQQELVNEQIKEEADLQKEGQKLHKDKIDADSNIKKLDEEIEKLAAEIEMLKAKVSENQSKLQKAEQAMASNSSAQEAQATKLAAEKEKLSKLQAELEELKRDW
jgi:DNA repair exonuclease SbcCD ATPase subunit